MSKVFVFLNKLNIGMSKGITFYSTEIIGILGEKPIQVLISLKRKKKKNSASLFLFTFGVAAYIILKHNKRFTERPL